MPTVSSTSGAMVNGSSFHLYGSGFGTKEFAKPLFWWDVNDGTQAPNAVLGRSSTWNGEATTDSDFIVPGHVRPGSNASFGRDLGTTEGIVMGWVGFNPLKPIYILRTTYDDFNVNTDYAIRLRYTNPTGTLSVGQMLTGLTSGATGVIAREGVGTTTAWFFMSHSEGTIADNADPQVDFILGETMETATGSCVNSESVGTYRTFNYKMLRFWPDPGASQTLIYLTQHYQTHAYITTENTYSAHGASLHLSSELTGQTPNQWVTEEFLYQTSSDIDVEDGIFYPYKDGVAGLPDANQRFVYLDVDSANRYTRFVNQQVSNGCEPGSVVYFDHLYADESWQRVLFTNEPTYEGANPIEVQIPTAWSDTHVTVQVRTGALNPMLPVYAHVWDAQNQKSTPYYLGYLHDTQSLLRAA